MKKTQSFIEGVEGKKLNVLTFSPEGRTKGIVHIIHGMAEHAKRYSDFATFLAEQSYTVYIHDHRGHGKSLAEGQEAGLFDKTDSFEAMIEDIGLVQAHIESEENSKSITLLGHSMGSLLLRAYLQRNPKNASRAIIMGTMKRYTPVFPSIMLAMSAVTSGVIPRQARNRFIARMMNNSLNRPFRKGKTKYDWLSTDPKVVEAYIEDELAGYAYNGRFYNSFFKTLITVNSRSNIAKTVNIPLLFISGKQDPLSNSLKTISKLKKVYEREIPEANITAKPIFNARHELLNAPQKEYIYDYLLHWIETAK